MSERVSRRQLLVGGGAGVGLVVAWALWPRRYPANLTLTKGEHGFGAWLKIGEDGRVTVAVPQAETGQGSWTALAQIAAGELGADWRQVGVEPAPLNPLYANDLGWRELFEGGLDVPLAGPSGVARMLTGGSTTIRQFERPVREAAAAARALLCKAAARRWGVEWTACDTAEGFVVHGKDRLRFGELAAGAAGEKAPGPVTLRALDTDRLAGKPLPRLDLPAKLDGSATFAGDVRLPGMVYASIRHAPAGGRLVGVDRAAARLPGVLAVVEQPGWVVVAANSWWAADRALARLRPRFERPAPLATGASIDAALDHALDGAGKRIAAAGDLSAMFKGAQVLTADYRAGLAVHAAIETLSVTARLENGRLELWLPTQAPAHARAVAAAAVGLAESAVTIHATLAGGSFGARLEADGAAEAAVLASALGKPVQLIRSRAEETLTDRFRPAAAARLTARLSANGTIAGWLAKIAAPATGHELAARRGAGDPLRRAGDPYAVAGALPPYRMPAYAIDHHPADIGVPTGHWQGGMRGPNCFFSECFVDELAHVANIEALSFRIAMLGGEARLARCLSTAATLGGWEGGVIGSGQGIACAAFRGSFIAVFAEASMAGEDISVDRLVAAVDCGRQINPGLVRQQIEGGLILGMSTALGSSTGVTDGLPDARGFGALHLPRLADTPDITVELIASDDAPGGVAELAVPPVAPAIANALRAATGRRLRHLPLQRA